MNRYSFCKDCANNDEPDVCAQCEGGDLFDDADLMARKAKQRGKKVIPIVAQVKDETFSQAVDHFQHILKDPQ